jgi:hypothetical protein
MVVANIGARSYWISYKGYYDGNFLGGVEPRGLDFDFCILGSCHEKEAVYNARESAAFFETRFQNASIFLVGSTAAQRDFRRHPQIRDRGPKLMREVGAELRESIE